MNINEEIVSTISDSLNNKAPIIDGPLSVNEYYNAPIKIMWLMKEAYDDEGDGGWSFTDFYTKDYDGFYSDLIRGKSRGTWQPVVYTSYGILKACNNENIKYNQIPDIWNKPELAKSLSNIAWINVQKLPSKKGSRTDMNHIKDALDTYCTIIKKQIDLLNPDIIICGGLYRVHRLFNKLFGTSIENKIDQNSWVEYCLIDNKLIISAYHPSYACNKEKYVNDIIAVVKEKFNF